MPEKTIQMDGLQNTVRNIGNDIHKELEEIRAMMSSMKVDRNPPESPGYAKMPPDKIPIMLAEFDPYIFFQVCAVGRITLACRAFMGNDARHNLSRRFFHDTLHIRHIVRMGPEFISGSPMRITVDHDGDYRAARAVIAMLSCADGQILITYWNLTAFVQAFVACVALGAGMNIDTFHEGPSQELMRRIMNAAAPKRALPGEDRPSKRKH